MNIRIYTGGDQLILKIGIRSLSDKPVKIRLVVSDADQANTVFTNRENVIVGDKYFYVRMPLSPKVALVQVYNDIIGNRKKEEETTFQLIGPGIEKMPLEKKMDMVDMGNPEVKSFVGLAQRFCYNAGTLDTGYYKSRLITINYVPAIMSKAGTESSTPARISEKTKIIEVSQKIFIPFTVPMRFGILCHEFAHCYKNENPISEVEADLQGLLIYLGLGYPRVEAYEAWIDTVIRAETQRGAVNNDNRRRIAILKKFIDDFEENKILMYE